MGQKSSPYRAKQYGLVSKCELNNESEVHAMLSVVRALVILYEMGQLLTRYVVVRGGLETILKFMTQDNKFKKLSWQPWFGKCES